MGRLMVSISVEESQSPPEWMGHFLPDMPMTSSPLTFCGEQHRQTLMNEMSCLYSRCRALLWSAEISWSISYEKQKSPCDSIITSHVLNQLTDPFSWPIVLPALWGLLSHLRLGISIPIFWCQVKLALWKVREHEKMQGWQALASWLSSIRCDFPLVEQVLSPIREPSVTPSVSATVVPLVLSCHAGH